MTGVPRVSVVIPAYNAAAYLPEAIESVLAQTFPVAEVIVVNDGSTDGTAKLLERYAGAPFHILNVENGGVSRARNLGISVATGDFIAFLDADDVWHEEKIALQVELMQEAPEIGFCFSDSVSLEDSGEASYFSYVPEFERLSLRPVTCGSVVEGDTLSAMLSCRLNPFWTSVVMIRRSSLGDIRFPPGVRLCEDFVYFVRCFMRARVGFVRRALMSKRQHDTNSVSSSFEFLAPQVEAINLLLRDSLTAVQRKLLRRQRGRALAALGHAQFWRGEHASAGWSYLRALGASDMRKTALVHLAALPFVATGAYIMPRRVRQLWGGHRNQPAGTHREEL